MATSVKVMCPRCGAVEIRAERIVIDPDDDCYRFLCPSHRGNVDKRLSEEVFAVLREHGAPTLDEMVLSFSALLDDERNLERFIRTAPKT